MNPQVIVVRSEEDLARVSVAIKRRIRVSSKPVEVVLSELNKGRSTQFDPELVELTVNSVTVRRLISDPSSIPEYLPEPRIRARAEARRLNRAGQNSIQGRGEGR